MEEALCLWIAVKMEDDMRTTVVKRVTVFMLVLTFLCISAPCYADGGGPLRKLGRGLANMATGVLEVPRTIVTVTEEDGYVAGVSYGVVKGVAWAVLRSAVGAYETLTFLIPLPFHYDPILEPEFLLSEEY